MNFEYKLQKIETPDLTIEYFKVPWDTEIIGRPVAEICSLLIRNESAAKLDFEVFKNWCENEKIILCNCRVDQDCSKEILFLQETDFRFIELHYLLNFRGLQSQNLATEEILVVEAELGDRERLAEIAGTIFEHGRFHQDLRLGRVLGNKRYRTWLLNSFERPTQKVLKCLLDNQLAAFFVVENPAPNHCHWCLVGMAPEFAGKGLAKRVWRGLMYWHQQNGIDVITTSISSHNLSVFNLYVALGFRFPLPQITFHWMPPGVSLQIKI